MADTKKAPRHFYLRRDVEAKVETAKAILVSFINLDTKEVKEIWLPKETCSAEKHPRPYIRRFTIAIPAWLLAKNGMDDVDFLHGSRWHWNER